ncbi:cytochrome c-type biogenesis protein [Lysobacter sp. A289]
MNRYLRMIVLPILLALLPTVALAQATGDRTPIEFSDQGEADRFHALTEELRCVKCQNQSLADSDAPIAHDLRHEVLTLMRQDKTDGEVKQYLVARYGEFVLYRPQVDASTWLLWFGPAVLLLFGGLVVVNVVRKRSGSNKTANEAINEDQEW